MMKIKSSKDRFAIAVNFPKERHLTRKIKPSPKAKTINIIPLKGRSQRRK